MHSRAAIKKDLQGIGIREGGFLMPHVSMRAVGPVEDGASGLLDALLNCVGEGGTLFTVFGADDTKPFVATTSPADPEMGVFAEVFRQHPQAQVNDHVAARCAAIGPLAQSLISEPPLHDYYAPGSPVHRFAEHNGQVLRLGADKNTVTLTHVAEYLADVPNKRRARRRYVRADSGEQWIECLEDCEGIADWQHGDYFAQILLDFLDTGKASIGPVGTCQAELLPGKTFVRFAVEWIEKHFK